MTSLIVDASVAVKWFLAEPDHVKARNLVTTPYTFIAPELIVAEFGNVLWKKYRQGKISALEIQSILRIFPAAFSYFIPLIDLFDEATKLSLHLDHPIYDCFYLALAKKEGCELVTADNNLYRLGKQVSLQVRTL